MASDKYILENLPNLPLGYTYLAVYTNDYEKVVRIKEVKDQSSAEVWLKKYEQNTKTTWRKSATYPNCGKINIYRVDLRCIHLTDKRVKRIRSTQNTDCPAKINIIIKRYIAKSRAKIIDNLVSEWPAIVTFKATHNHCIISAAVLKYRDMSDGTREKLQTLFRQGHNPSSALHCLKTDFLLENPESYYEMAADTHYVPTLSSVHKLFEKEFSKEYGCFTGDLMLENLKVKLDDYSKVNDQGMAKLCKTKDKLHYFVILCTPIMTRVHKNVSQSRELVLVDASGGMDKQRHRVYFFITPTVAGGLPLMVIITDSEKEYVFDEALQEMKNILPPDSFYKQNYPTVFLTDNDLKERNPLKKNFSASVLLLCQFHFLKACWTWLCDSKHGILQSKRQELYFMIKNIVYALTVDDALKHHTILLNNNISKNYPLFIKYYLNLWNSKEDWATCYRQKYMLRGSNTTNYVEVVFRILKDCILNRVMAFSVIQLVDYILTRYEMYMEKRLIDFTNGRYPKAMLKRMLPKERDNVIYEVQKCVDMQGTFKVSSGENKNDYWVDIIHGTCSCSKGTTGALCSHASAVILRMEDKLDCGFNLVSENAKETMYYIATGKKCPSNWLKPLKEMPVSTSSLGILESNKILKSMEISEEPLNVHTPIQRKAEINILELSHTEKLEFENLFNRIKNGVQNQPIIFVPAVKKMLRNTNKFANTETGLISALHTFGKYSGLLPLKNTKKPAQNKQHRRKHSFIIGVQPTAIW